MSASSVAFDPAPVRTPWHRLRVAIRAHPALAAGAVVFALGWPALIAVHRAPSPLPLERSVAVAHVRASPVIGPALARLRWTRISFTPVDRRDEAVWFYDGPRLVMAAIVTASGDVPYSVNAARLPYAYGSNIANDPRVLALLSIVFVLMTAVWPLWRLRNLDVAVAASSVSAILLLNAETIDRMVLASYPALLYLALRCGWRALGPGRPAQESVPLFEVLSARWSAARRQRMLRMVAAACVLIVAMVGLSSPNVVDVGYAVMEGATAIVHGLLPYGHIGGVLHGDTYPIGSYLFYVPFAWLSPVGSTFDSADATLLVAVVAALLGAWALARAARSAARRVPAGGAGAHDGAGLRAAIAWLTFPPLLVTVSTGTTDVALAVILLGAILLWRRPAISTTLLAAGAWFKLIPVALLPLWLAPLRGRRLACALGAVAALSAAMIATLGAIGGGGAVAKMAHAIGYQAARSDPHSLWSLVGSVPLQQLMQAATLALIVGAAVRLRRDRGLAGDRARIAALSGAVLLALQISAGYWTYMYLVWVLPFLALSVLDPRSRPELARPRG